jgi:hydroxypyruvate isomerase
MPKFSANIELLYTEHERFEDRIRAAAKDGFKFVELWMSSQQDVATLAQVAADVDIRFTSILAEPRFNFTFPGADLAVFFDGLRQGIENAQKLGSPRIVLGSGLGFPGLKRPAQLDILAKAFVAADEIAKAEGIQLVLEPVNTRVDHPGALLDRTADAVYVVDQVNSSNFKLLFDVYHSAVEGEDVLANLQNYSSRIGYIQVADAPGRNQPGSGGLDWAKIFSAIDEIDYREPIGLEYYPSGNTTASLELLKTFE